MNHIATAILLSWNVTSTEYWPSGIQWPLLAGFGILQMGVPYVLFARGLRTLPGHQAAAIGLLEPILVPVWVFLAWNQAPDWWTLAAAPSSCSDSSPATWPRGEEARSRGREGEEQRARIGRGAGSGKQGG